MRLRAVFVFVVVLGLGCATTPPAGEVSGDPPPTDADTASVKAEKDRAACRKMCELAGNTEGNAEAVAECQAKCDAGTSAP